MPGRRRALRPFVALAAMVAVVAGALAMRRASELSGGASPVAGCSLVVNPSPSQCRNTADCLALGPAFARSFCSDGACQATCASNHDCSFGSTVGPRICRADRTCAALLSVDCPREGLIADPGDLDDDTVLWFGLIAPLDSATARLSQAKIDAANLARHDFLVTAGGLPPVSDGGANRHFAFVTCDESVNPDRAAAHLTDDLGVPAIIGPVYSGDLISVATDVTIQKGVLLISPSATSTFITTLPRKNGLVWRTAPSDTEQGAAMALLVTDVLEPALKQTELDGGLLRVGVAYKGDGYGVGLAGALKSDLLFNDASADKNGSNYGAFNYGGANGDAADGGLYTQAVDALLALKPHVVIIVGTKEGVTNILVPLEHRWTETNEPSLPRYVFSDGAFPVPELLAAVNGNSALRQRILGTTPGTNAGLYQGFVTYYLGNVHDGTVPIDSTAATYDAAYMLAYAAAAVGAKVTGGSLSRAFVRLVSPLPIPVAGGGGDAGGGAPPIDVGPDGINPTLNDLANGGDVRLSGTSGPLAFDLATGDTVTDIQVWCLGGPPGGGAGTFETTTVFYGAVSQTLQGLLQGQVTCP